MDKQEFIQDIESTVSYLLNDDLTIDPSFHASGLSKEWHDKIKELASIHRQLKMLDN